MVCTNNGIVLINGIYIYFGVSLNIKLHIEKVVVLLSMKSFARNKYSLPYSCTEQCV